VGVAIAIVVRAGSSTGGMDIPPLLLQKFAGIPVSRSLYAFDLVIIAGQTVLVAPDMLLYGVLMVLGTGENAGKLVMPTADADTKLLCKEVTDIYDGVVAYRFVVNKLAGNYYLVENGFEFNDAVDYDLNTYATAVGKLLRAHPLQVGEEFVTDKVAGTPTAGVEYGVKADGTVGAAS
jgi:hypothetical protein